MRNLYILDPDCRHPFSHNLMATYRSCQAARVAGYDPHVIVNRAFPQSEDVLDKVAAKVHRTWTTMAFNDVDDSSNVNLTKFDPILDGDFPRWQKFQHSMLDLHKSEGLGPDSVIYMHTFSAPALMGILQYLLTLRPQQRPTFYCLIYCTIDILQGPQLDGISNLQVLQRLRDEGLIGTNVFFHVETLGLQLHYAELGFDFPVIMGPLEPVFQGERPPRTAGEKPILAYLGEARDEKGFELVPDILDALAARGALDQIQVRVQIYSNPSNNTAPIRDAKKRLRDLHSAGHDIVLLDVLSPEQFTEELARADVVLMPYQVSAYKARGSGVVYDALTFGTEVVCTPGTDIALTFADYGVFVPLSEAVDDFADSVSEAIATEGNLETSGLIKYEIAHFFETLFTAHDAAMPSTKVEPDTRPVCILALALPVDGGHGFVEIAQVKVLQELGAKVLILGIPWVNGLDGLKYFSEDFLKSYFSQPYYQGIPAYFPYIIDDTRFSMVMGHYQKGRTLLYAMSEFLRLVDDALEVGPLISQALELNPAEITVFNYSWMAPLIPKLVEANGGRAMCSICEVHDFQSKQNIFRRKGYADRHGLGWSYEAICEDFEAESEIEVDAISQFEASVFISDDLRQQLEASDVGHVVYPPNASLPNYQDFVQLGIPEQDLSQVRDILFDASVNDAVVTVDVLFVGTGHEANKNSLDFLMHEVMPKIRLEHPVRLFVVGNINRMYTEAEQEAQASVGTYFVGRVKDIDAWYAVARIIALAVTEGTGFPTKVIEAMSLGQCCSVTSRALYELSDKTERYFPVCETAEEMAEDILALLHSKEERLTRGAFAREFYNDFFSFENYLQKWSDVCELPFLKIPSEHDFYHIEAEDPFKEVINKITLPVKNEGYKLNELTRGTSGDWSYPEKEFRWIDGNTAHLLLRTSEHPIELRGVVTGAKISEGLPAEGSFIEISVNDRDLGKIPLSHSLEFLETRVAEPLLLCGCVKLTLKVPQGVSSEGDERNLSTLFDFVQLIYSERLDLEGSDIHPPSDTDLAQESDLKVEDVALVSQYELEGPYPKWDIESPFYWVGEGGITLKSRNGAPISGTLEITGFCDVPGQSVEVWYDNHLASEKKISTGPKGRSYFKEEIPVSGKLTKISAKVVRQFPPPDNRIVGFAVDGLVLSGVRLM